MRIRLSQTLPLAVLALTTTCLFSQTPSSISFSAPHQIPYPHSATYASAQYVAGDMNGDGKTDLVLGTQTNTSPVITQFQLLTGDGKGGFTSSPLPISSPTLGVLLIADVNGDGHQDIIHVYGGENDGNPYQFPGAFTVHLGDGHGHFHESSSLVLPVGFAYALLGDFNHDGKLDVAVSLGASVNGAPTDQVEIFLNHGDGTFTNSQSILTPGANERLQAVGDFNGDGKTDLAFIDNNANGVKVLKGNGNGTFQYPQADVYVFDSIPTSMAAADLNHDGKTDLVVALTAIDDPGAGTLPRIATLLAKQTGGFYWYAATSIPGTGYSTQLTDFDGDGKLDLVYFDGDNLQIRALKGEGGGKFAPSQLLLNPVTVLTYPDRYVLAAPLTTHARDAVFLSGQQAKGQGYLGVLLNQSK